jgi:hypothetical protein
MQHLTVGAFATDGDSGYDPAHEGIHAANLDVFLETGDVPFQQKFR